MLGLPDRRGRGLSYLPLLLIPVRAVNSPEISSSKDGNADSFSCKGIDEKESRLSVFSKTNLAFFLFFFFRFVLPLVGVAGSS